jgi:hypothetical protein
MLYLKTNPLYVSLFWSVLVISEAEKIIGGGGGHGVGAIHIELNASQSEWTTAAPMPIGSCGA